MKKIKISILIIAVLLVGIVCSYSNAATSSSTTSGEQTIPDGIYIIRSKINSKFVLDVNGASIYNGTNVQLYEYTDVPQKKYKVQYLGNGAYSIIATHSDKALDVKDASKKKGANVQQWEWNNTDAQKWIIKDVGGGYYSIISKCNGLYVDVLDAKAQNYQNIQMCDGNGLDAQKFKFEKVGNLATMPTNPPSDIEATKTLDDGKYVIRSTINSNYVIDVANGSTANGANIQLYKYDASAKQQFNVSYIGDGLYKILASHSNKSIDVKDASTKIGANVQQCEQNKEDAQKWIIKDNKDGTYSIISKCNGLYVDVHNAVAANGTNIQMCNSNRLNAQKFKFEKVNEQEKPTEQEPPKEPEGTKTISDGIYAIQSAINKNYTLDVTGASSNNGANIQLYKYTATDNQHFQIKYLNNGYYSITAFHSNKSIEVKDGSTKKGANVQQNESNDKNSQQWVIKKNNDGTYSIISRCNGLYIDVYNAVAANGTNIQMCDSNGLNAQKFVFKEVEKIQGEQTLPDGTYIIRSSINKGYVFDVSGGSKDNYANIQLWNECPVPQQRFKLKYLDNGYYRITATHSGKALDVKDASTQKGANVQQYQSNDTNAQQWIIKDNKDGTYSIISRCNGLYVDVYNAVAANGTNIQMCDGNGLNAQKFIFEEVETTINIDTTKYPGYKEKIEALMELHPNWNFELLYTGLSLDEVVSGEAKVHSRNLVPSDKSGEWICSVCGTKPYDSGWYCASEKATAYYMDPRNFLDGVNIFQFQDVNEYISGVFTLEGIQNQINNTYLQNYANDINTACKNKNVNPYYIISRLIQEQGRNGTTIGKGMDGGDGKTYYNPFNIGASGNGWDEIYANALARAKKEGWDTMEKAIEGGITFCKANWLENYQNTLYQNKFDIDTRNGTALYTHQYMQNLMGAYSEAQLLQQMYKNTGKIDSSFTFIIPVYEKMSKNISPLPEESTELYPMDVETTGTNINVRKEANANSSIIKTIAEKGTKLLSIERGINTNWQKVIFTDGTIGYISGTYLKQIDDQVNCNIKAKVKTNDGQGCNTRLGPSISIQKGPYLDEATEVTIINKGTYNNINGYDWYRIKLSDGRQTFVPGKYLQEFK